MVCGPLSLARKSARLSAEVRANAGLLFAASPAMPRSLSSMNKTLRLLLPAAVSLVLASCTTTDGPQQSAAANPLLGTWQFDPTASVVHNAVYSANANLTEAQQRQVKQLLDLSEGSTISFTPDLVTTTIRTGASESMKYTVKSVDANGNIVIADSSGAEATYSVSGGTLMSPAPQYHFVGVYKAVR